MESIIAKSKRVKIRLCCECVVTGHLSLVCVSVRVLQNYSVQSETIIGTSLQVDKQLASNVF